MKINIMLLILAALFAATVTTSCEKIKGRGTTVTEMRSVNGFTSIYYLGQPAVNARISGSGKIVRL